MNSWIRPQLMDMAIQSLLRDEAFALRARKELPVKLFPTVFTVAFRGGHRKVLSAMVQAWPLPQLHLGPLLVDPKSYQDSLWAILDSLDVVSRPGKGGKSKLKVIGFRPDVELIQSSDSSEEAASSLYSDATHVEPEVTLPETRSRQRRHWKKRPCQAWQPLDLYINLSLGTSHSGNVSSSVLRKVRRSCRPLRLFCRKLHIKDMPVIRTMEILNLLQLEFIQELEICGCSGLPSGDNKFARQVEHMKNLCSFTLAHLIFGTSAAESQLPSHAFISFLSHLSRLGHLRMLHPSSYHISGHLYCLLSYLPAALETLELPCYTLLHRDICCLSQSPQASHLKKLDLSKNDLSQIARGALEALVRETSDTLQELVLDHCGIRDLHLMVLLPAPSCCFHLHSLSFSGNWISSYSLENLLQLVAKLAELKVVVCPYPIECHEYMERMRLCSIESQQFISVTTMVHNMLKASGRENLKWIFTLNTFL
ncbi:melanoma antigen preferentially expressed in tumors-like [Hippopotamus amphibius kiboko]|uniref:melanoma antigen preferentially expressed in tumors-like n=1 Tax=Hippopotamus amphibius kiboko TaxID=575201 RepID=UPI0025934A03|nr:melanoma antigen preferentially expressed in tumors-like [Hippopotamus amphibius kiboko]